MSFRSVTIHFIVSTKEEVTVNTSAYIPRPYQVIPGNLQKYVSTNRSLLQCKTLPAHFGNNMMVYCLLNVT